MRNIFLLKLIDITQPEQRNSSSPYQALKSEIKQSFT